MSPENARIFIAEDSKAWVNIITQVLRSNGHRVISVATTLSGAIDTISQLKNYDIQVAVIDANMDFKNNQEGGEDGQIMLTAIRAFAPEVKVVGMSSHPIAGVDIDIGKKNVHLLGEAIARL